MQAETLTPPKFGQIICPQRRVCVFRTRRVATTGLLRKFTSTNLKRSSAVHYASPLIVDAVETWRCVRDLVRMVPSTLARDICGAAFNFPESLVVVCGIYTRICFNDFVFHDCVTFTEATDFKKDYLHPL